MSHSVFGSRSLSRHVTCAKVPGEVRASLLACSLAAAGAVACSGAADIPDTPDLRALLASYDSPTARLDATTAAATLQSSPSLETLAAGFHAAEYVMGNVDHASSTSANSAGERVRLQGALGLHIRCPGDGGNPNYDESVNGSISLTLAVADNRIRRSFGGQAKACVLEGSLLGHSARVVLDGPLLFDVGRDIGIGQGWSGELLASLPGTLTVEGYEFRSISGRLSDGQFQYLVTLGDGSTAVLQLGDDGITIRDNGGVWFCKEGQPCAEQ